MHGFWAEIKPTRFRVQVETRSLPLQWQRKLPLDQEFDSLDYPESIALISAPSPCRQSVAMHRGRSKLGWSSVHLSRTRRRTSQAVSLLWMTWSRPSFRSRSRLVIRLHPRPSCPDVDLRGRTLFSISAKSPHKCQIYVWKSTTTTMQRKMQRSTYWCIRDDGHIKHLYQISFDSEACYFGFIESSSIQYCNVVHLDTCSQDSPRKV